MLFARMRGIACSSLLQRSAHALLRGTGSSDGRWGFEQQWTTAAAAEPMRESPVRYFTPEDCRLPERTQIAPVDSAEVMAGHGGASDPAAADVSCSDQLHAPPTTRTPC